LDVNMTIIHIHIHPERLMQSTSMDMGYMTLKFSKGGDLPNKIYN
jgi:hypothetical protein